MTARRIWITRTSPDAAETGERLERLGYTAVVAPALELEPLPARINFAGVGALVFTSRNGVRLAKVPAGLRGPVFTVGDRTADAARAAGHRDVRSASGDVQALARLILRELDAFDGVALHLGALAPAGDLAAQLQASGVPFRHAALYRTRWAPGPELARVLSGPLDGLLIHSPEAARRLAALGDVSLPRTMRAICISEAAKRALAPLGLRRVAVAAQPTEAAMLAALLVQLPPR